MYKKFFGSMVFLAVFSITRFTIAQDTVEEDTAPFTIGVPVVQGNGCPAGTYSVILSPDGSELSILYSAFIAQTDATHSYDFSNCNIAIPIEVPSGITVGLVGIDYRGLAFIPAGGIGALSREFFFAGTHGQRITSFVNVYNVFYELYYPDDTIFTIWSECGDDIIARSNATVYVTRPLYSPYQAMMTVFSEDWDVSIMFHLVWDYC